MAPRVLPLLHHCSGEILTALQKPIKMSVIAFFKLTVGLTAVAVLRGLLGGPLPLQNFVWPFLETPVLCLISGSSSFD